jgi:hypothetical protein
VNLGSCEHGNNGRQIQHFIPQGTYAGLPPGATPHEGAAGQGALGRGWRDGQLRHVFDLGHALHVLGRNQLRSS